MRIFSREPSKSKNIEPHQSLTGCDKKKRIHPEELRNESKYSRMNQDDLRKTA